jgi:uncharacterized protein DUF5658
MRRLCRRWDTKGSLFGDFVVLGFVIAQCLDGVFTYLGMSLWGPNVEGNPLIRSAVTYVGPGLGLAGAKLFAVSLGIALHLFRVHNVVAILTGLYIVGALIPWAVVLTLGM